MLKLSCLTTLVFILLASNPSYPQCTYNTTTIENMLEPGVSVIEARVKSTSSFWGSAGEMIYTRYELEVYQVFKGDVRRSFDLVTLGGVVGDAAVKVVPTPELRIGDVAIFALKPAVYSLPRFAYQPMQSVIPNGPLATYSPAADEACLPDGRIFSRSALYARITASTGNPPVPVRSFTPPAINRNSMPQVDSITPGWVAAGVGDIVTIYGEGFGEDAGTVFFRDADRGGNGYTAALPWHIVSWTPTSIEVKVPHKAGSGAPMLLTGAGSIGFSPFDININYAFNNLMSSGAFHEPKLIDHNSRDDGGYLFSLSSNTDHNGVAIVDVEGAMDALITAAGAWQDSIGLPMYISGSCPMVHTPFNGSADDGQNVITFDHDEWDIREQLGEQVLAATISRYARCGDSEWELTDVDIVVRRGAQYNEADDLLWSFDGTPATNEIDFQSVMIHEMGHAIQLQHVIDPNAVMHYAATFGASHDGLGIDDDIAGGLHAIAGSRSYSPPVTSCFPMEHFDRQRRLGKYNPGHACLPDEDELIVDGVQSAGMGDATDFDLKIYPNPKPKGIPLQLSVYMEASGEVSLLLFSNNGQLIAQRQVQLAQGRHTLEWPLPDVPSGFYQLLVQHSHGRTPEKIVIP
jgi:hypothetical protein